jgi:hypothetical protein
MCSKQLEMTSVTADTAGNLTGNPYLSIVIPSRNDGHGGNMQRRLQVSLNGLLGQMEKYHLESEILLIDWNPPPEKPPLRDIINWPAQMRYCTVRNMVVPPGLHNKYKYSDKIKFGVGAMNCGIRRARGQFVLPRASDVIYSDELVAYIAQKKLGKDERYRVDRYDVDRGVLQYDTLSEQLDFSRNHVIHRNTQDIPAGWHRLLPENRLPALHTNASGDFQLMSRDRWHLLRGYREPADDILSAYADSLLSFASYAAGVHEVILKYPLCIYHIDHDNKFVESSLGSGLPLEKWLILPFLPAGFNKAIRTAYRLFLSFIGYRFKGSLNGIPTLHYSEYRRIARDMVAGRRPYIFNDEDWGLGTASLEEYIISTAEWDKGHGKH